MTDTLGKIDACKLPEPAPLATLDAGNVRFRVFGETRLGYQTTYKTVGDQRVILGRLEVDRGANLRPRSNPEDRIEAGQYLAAYYVAQRELVVWNGGDRRYATAELDAEATAGFQAAILEAVELQAALIEAEAEFRRTHRPLYVQLHDRADDPGDEGKGDPCREE